jgi:hypothetical protein
MKKILGVILSLVLISSGITTAKAAQIILVVASDFSTGYDRSLFKHWIDADKDGCNTRNEVLIEEAIVKPKIGKKCKLTGGSWLSPYDLKTTTSPSSLDIDHTVPLAEAWRSGAWKWTPTLREQYANDLRIAGALVAVSLSLNRQKGDKDVAEWVPNYNQCKYYSDWIVVKATYSLTVDEAEASALSKAVTVCNFTNVTIGSTFASPTPTPSAQTSDFKMPLIYESIKTSLDKWNTFGFAKAPIVVQDKPAVSGWQCDPRKDSDLILSQEPKYGTTVNSQTQVTLTLMCFSKPPTTPTQSSTPQSTSDSSSSGMTTLCNDGTYSSSTGSGTCSGHGGIASATPSAQSTPAPMATSSGTKQCYVSGYTRKNGTVVKGYYRDC